ncbi:EAL domain-containing protein [Peribacillus asahii]|uniref:bifunctional diguanylate cyclase/phosphodiesterase n=1 Tax=Peribacillus asahii TaxID=228899 RepID=UPI00382A5C01
MKIKKQNIQSSVRDGLGLTIPLLLLIPALLFSNQLYGILGKNNYVTIHLMVEIFIIIASFTIAIQAWLIFPYILSNHRLYIGALFLSVGLLTLIHTLSYKGMPFFIKDSSAYSATWFYMIERLTQALGLLLILTSKPKKIHFMQRRITYSLACLYTFVWIFLIYSPYGPLPHLVIERIGTTPLKNSLQYLAIMLQCLTLLFLWRNFHKDRRQNTVIIVASVYLILGDLMFTTYQSVYDIKNFMGHFFQLSGFYFLMRTFYSTSVEKPFQSLMETQKQLKKSEENLHYMAYHDELTKLPNSRFLTEKLSTELSMPKTKKAILMIEIDRLKSINESLGHSFIDLMLQEVATRLRASLPPDLFISQIGRGEFTILLHSVKDHEDVVQVCKQIQKGMKKPFQLQHFLLNITLNIGIAVYPKHGTNQEELLKHAQVAMHEAQKATERYVFYHSKMGQQLIERLVLEQDLHYALDNGEIHLEYQPQINLRTGSIDSVEALVRWQHPEKGLISPAAFIPIAEETGLIVPIGEWVLETACRQAKQWHNEGISHIGVAVNLSTGQFFQQNLVEMVEDILARTNLPPHYLELEITESMTVDTNHMTDILHDLKQLGVKIAVDDFGTGYSSMYYLKKFPIDCLKIDRSFVRNVQSNHHDDVLISMMISMAKHLELKVVAEGVEETGQLSFLADRDCDIIQGYLFSKPIDPEELSANFDTIQKKVLSITQLKEVV